MPYTFCTASFVHAPTLPLENRVGIMHCKKASQHVYDATADTLLTVQQRVDQDMPVWRRFTEGQVAHIEDFIKSPYVLDAASAFNLRPPELLFFNDYQLYTECFVAVRTQSTVCCNDVASQPWMDGASRLIKLQACSIGKALDFVNRKAAAGDASATEMQQLVFEPISRSESFAIAKFVQPDHDREVMQI